MHIPNDEFTIMFKEKVQSGEHTYSSWAAWLNKKGYTTQKGFSFCEKNLRSRIERIIPDSRERQVPRRRKANPKNDGKWEAAELLSYPHKTDCFYPRPTQEEQRVGSPFHDIDPFTNKLL